MSTDTPDSDESIDRARALLDDVETPHPLIQVAREAAARGDIAASLTHVQSIVVHRDADQRRLRRAEQALIAALELADRQEVRIA